MTIKGRIRTLLEPIRRDGRFNVRTAISKGRVITRAVGGKQVSWLITNRSDEIQAKQIQSGFYELAELEQLHSDIGPRTAVLDVGANIGNHAVFFITHMGCKNLIAVEPFEAAFTHLLANLSLNHANFANLHFIHCALGATSGRASIVPPTSFNIGLTKVSLGDGEVTVITGDELVGTSPVDFIKVDVEGMEVEVLSGLVETIAAQRPAIYVEASEETVEGVMGFLDPLRYRLVRKLSAYGFQYNLTFLPI